MCNIISYISSYYCTVVAKQAIILKQNNIRFLSFIYKFFLQVIRILPQRKNYSGKAFDLSTSLNSIIFIAEMTKVISFWIRFIIKFKTVLVLVLLYPACFQTRTIITIIIPIDGILFSTKNKNCTKFSDTEKLYLIKFLQHKQIQLAFSRLVIFVHFSYNKICKIMKKSYVFFYLFHKSKHDIRK